MAEDGMTPETREQYSAQIPAVQALSSLGWEYISTAECLAARGGTGAA